MSGTPQQNTTDANNELFRLYLQTGDLSVYDYIQSGWTKPVSVAVQPRVQAIIRRYSNPAAVIPVISAGQSPVSGAPGAPPDQSSLATLPTGPAATPPPASSVWPDQPPQAAGAGYRGGAQAVPDPNALPVTGKGGGFFGPPPARGATNFSGVVDEFGRPAGQNYANTVATDQAAVAAQRAKATAGAAAAGQKGGQAVSGFIPASGSPLTVPVATPGQIDPNSTAGEAGYTAAQGGDQNALDAIMASLLAKFGIDVMHPGLYTGDIVKTLSPYLKPMLEYAGLASGQPTAGHLRGIADRFGSMIGSADTMGQIRNFASQALPGLQGMLAAPAGAIANPANQQGLVNDFLGMLTAGNSPLQQNYQQGILNNANLGYQIDQTVNGAQGDFLTYLRNNAAKMPGSDLLAQIIGASR